MDKLQLIQKELKAKNLDALLISSPYTRLWLSQLNSTAGWILVLKDKTFLIIDGRYYHGLVNNLPQNVNQIVLATNYFNELKKIIKQRKMKNIGFESEYLTYQTYLNFEDNLKNLALNFVPVKTIKFRIIKSEDEIIKLQKAADIITKVFEDLKNFILPGRTEIDVANKIINLIQNYNGDGPSFSPIVAWNESSSNPHYHPSSTQIIGNNGILLIDMGAFFQGFASDMTRVLFIGSQNKINPELFKIYQIVKEAQQIGINSVKPGVRAAQVHKNVYNHIESYGYGKYFIHRTGHGLGIEVHEMPYVAEYDDTILTSGMVITIEPGIYLPGLGGVRIEDDVLVGENKAIVLTKKATKELSFIKKYNEKSSQRI